MAKTLCGRCGAEIPKNGKIWDFSWFSKFEGKDYEPDGEPDEVRLCSCCHKEIDDFVRQKQGFPKQKSKRKTKKQQIWDLYEQGASNREIAETLNITTNNVAAQLQQIKLQKGLIEKSTKPKKKKPVDKGKVRALRKAGWKISDIAGDMGISEAAVCEVLNNHVEVGRRCERS